MESVDLAAAPPASFRGRNLIGEPFERWTVIGWAHYRGVRPVWWCECQCGAIRRVLGQQLTGGHSLSCGCYQKDRVREVHVTHGATIGGNDTREYRCWTAMRNRCLDPNHKHFARYGGAGVKIHPSWITDFAAFLADVGSCPSDIHTLDRFPIKDGDYVPGNVRWATPAEQHRNRRDNVMLTWKGETLCATDWAARVGMSRRAFLRRVENWGLARAIVTPVLVQYRQR